MTTYKRARQTIAVHEEVKKKNTEELEASSIKQKISQNIVAKFLLQNTKKQ